jgi:hypothetical protein
VVFTDGDHNDRRLFCPDFFAAWFSLVSEMWKGNPERPSGADLAGLDDFVGESQYKLILNRAGVPDAVTEQSGPAPYEHLQVYGIFAKFHGKTVRLTGMVRRLPFIQQIPGKLHPI